MNHIPVLLEEIKVFILENHGKTVLDCTFGGGGHTNALRNLGLNVLSIDRDPSVNADIYDRFSNFSQHLENKVDFIIADLGMSTKQLEKFSYKNEEILDFRFDYNKDNPFWIELQYMPRFKIEKIIKDYGEEKNFRKIASNIDIFRLKTTIKTNKQLREAIGIDDFKVLSRVFQAFRIYVNKELEELEILLEKIPNYVNIGALIITFHSLEDRLVKNAFKLYKNNGYILPTTKEIETNPKSRSAKLRYFVKNNLQ